MNIEEKYERAVSALKKIAEFTHAEGCSGAAPIYECDCYDKSQWDMAREALEALGEA